jgi:hypothetical protein
MATVTRTAALLIALAVGLLPQSTTVSGGASIGTSFFSSCSNCITSSGLVVWGGSTSTSGDRDTIYGIPTETRKDDGKGPSIRLVKLTAKNWGDVTLAPADYIARAQRIRYESAGTDEARMLQAIHDAHLHVYDFHNVDGYLYRQALKHGSNYRWVWEPMREKDMKAAQENSGQYANAGYVYGSKQYDREIPDRVLADVERLLDCAPAETMLLVSDFRAVNPDPFLAITTPRMLAAGKIFIVEQWDEPGFTDGEVTAAPTIAPATQNLTVALK